MPLGVGRASVGTDQDHLASTVACRRNDPGTDCAEDCNQPNRKARSRSLPTSQLDASLENEVNPSNEHPPKSIQDQPPVQHAEVSQTHYRYRKKVKPVEYRRPRYLSNASRDETDSDADEESTTLLTAPGWAAADRHTTNAQIETQL